ncbi:hypothetical protein BJY16_000446 [Actinoplanes octamycinicus]|uniref:Uncharacterized protein n=1 Tax=Actinoplanes octamycinicus TaxID=135948 RepID=A0A7W7GRK2_9ACTN|nr:hypothetical protein [Actinoplanes octamycinicus]
MTGGPCGVGAGADYRLRASTGECRRHRCPTRHPPLSHSRTAQPGHMASPRRADESRDWRFRPRFLGSAGPLTTPAAGRPHRERVARRRRPTPPPTEEPPIHGRADTMTPIRAGPGSPPTPDPGPTREKPAGNDPPTTDRREFEVARETGTVGRTPTTGRIRPSRPAKRSGGPRCPVRNRDTRRTTWAGPATSHRGSAIAPDATSHSNTTYVAAAIIILDRWTTDRHDRHHSAGRRPRQPWLTGMTSVAKGQGNGPNPVSV